MKLLKLYVSILFLLSPLYNNSGLEAQVTIGSGIPPHKDALLDLKEDNGGSSEKGLLLPRVALSQTTSPSPLSEHVEGMTVYNTATTGDVVPGYYYSDGTKWILLGSGGSGSNPWRVSGTGSSATSNTDNIYQMGSVAVGYGGNSDPSAILNVQSTDKGVLLPKVTLTSATDNTTIPNPTTGLLVYNTGTDANFNIGGYMFWDGSQWRIFGNSTSKRASAVLNCAGATLSPNQEIKANTPIITGSVIQIPYTGGNGGYIKGVTLKSLSNPNVIATISDGVLSEGNGVLNFALSGIPTASQEAPMGIIFTINDFIAENPDISDDGYVVIRVGDGTSKASEESTAVMGHLSKASDNYYALQCDSPDGKFSVRVEVPSDVTSVAWGNQNLNIQVKNNSSQSVSIIWNASYEFGVNTGNWGTSGVVAIPSNVWGGASYELGATIWRTATGNSTTDLTTYAYWGQVGIYDAANGGPEYRRYTWIPIGNNKVAYEITVMAALNTTTPTVGVHPTGVKAYIRFQQITAL